MVICCSSNKDCRLALRKYAFMLSEHLRRSWRCHQQTENGTHTKSNWILLTTTWTWMRTLKFQTETGLTYIMTAALWDPKQRTQLSCAQILTDENHPMINVLSFCSLVTQVLGTNTPSSKTVGLCFFWTTSAQHLHQQFLIQDWGQCRDWYITY